MIDKWYLLMFVTKIDKKLLAKSGSEKFKVDALSS